MRHQFPICPRSQGRDDQQRSDTFVPLRRASVAGRRRVPAWLLCSLPLCVARSAVSSPALASLSPKHLYARVLSGCFSSRNYYRLLREGHPSDFCASPMANFGQNSPRSQVQWCLSRQPRHSPKSKFRTNSVRVWATSELRNGKGIFVHAGDPCMCLYAHTVFCL